MASRVEIEFAQRGSTDIVRAWDAQNQAIASNTRKLHSQQQASNTYTQSLRRRREAQKAEEQQTRAAARVLSEIQTPQQRYLQQVAAAKQHHEAGRLSQAELTQSIKHYQNQLQQATGTVQKRAAAERDAAANQAAASRSAAAIIRSTQTAQERYNEQLQRAQLLEQQGELTKQQLASATDRYRSELRQATGEQDRHNDRQREARAIIERNRAPQDRYNRRLVTLRQHLRAGRISQREFNAEAARARGAMMDADKAASQFGRQRFNRVASSIRSVATGILGGAGVLAGLRFWINSNQRIIEQSDEIKTRYDTLQTRFAVQSDIPEFQERAALNKILDVAQTRRIDPNVIGDSATQLVSSGFNPREVLDGALNEFARGLNASNLVRDGLDGTELAKASGQFLASQGLEKNAANLRDVLAQVQQLFKTTDVQLSDLNDFARVASAFKGKLSIQEQLATFSVLRETEGGSGEASTLLRNLVGRTQTIRASNGKVKALAELGLQPEDVDLIGESITEVIERYAEAIQATQLVAPEAVRPAITKLFEERAVAGILNLAGTRDGVAVSDIIKQRVEAQSDTSSFEADSQRQERSRRAVLTQQQIRKDRALGAYSQDLDLLQNELSIFLTERRAAATTIVAAEKALTSQIALGLDRRASLNRALTVAGFASDENVSEVLNNLKTAKRDPTFNRRIDQLPGVTDASSTEERTAAQRYVSEGFNPLARLARVQREFNAQLDAVAETVREPERLRETFAQQFQQRVATGAVNKQSGQVESEAAALIRELMDQIGEAGRRRPGRLFSFGRTIETSDVDAAKASTAASVARLERLSNQFSESVDVQQDQLSVLRDIQQQLNQRPQVSAPASAPAPKRRTPRIAPLSRNGGG